MSTSETTFCMMLIQAATRAVSADRQSRAADTTCIFVSGFCVESCSASMPLINSADRQHICVENFPSSCFILYILLFLLPLLPTPFQSLGREREEEVFKQSTKCQQSEVRYSCLLPRPLPLNTPPCTSTPPTQRPGLECARRNKCVCM